MSKGNFFNNESVNNSALGKIERTLNISADGSVTFKTNLGRGSGTPVEIPGDSFDKFVTMMQGVAKERVERAVIEQQKSTQPRQITATESDDNTDSE